MYLSRVLLNVGLRETMKALASPSKFHGAIESSFSGEKKRRLWRLDTISGKQYILILSEDIPDLNEFASQYGYVGKYETKDYSPLLDKIKTGDCWGFRLTANPTISKMSENSRGKVLAHITAKHQKEWLINRSENNGFSVEEDSFTVVQSKWYRFYKKNFDKSPAVQLLSVTFEGNLTITDENKFKETLCNGIGREKAYGMGLLTVVKRR